MHLLNVPLITKEYMRATIDQVIDTLKEEGCEGCITGSCLLDANFETWEAAPDIDIFAYSQTQMVHIIDVLKYRLGYEPSTNTTLSGKGEKVKEKWFYDEGVGKSKLNLGTIKYEHDDNPIVINVSYRKYKNTVSAVVNEFDLSIIMAGIDIQTNQLYDARLSVPGSSYEIAQVNISKRSTKTWEVAKFLRQWDRVVKYHSRGYYMKHVAEFYIECIDGIIETGAIFDSDTSHEIYNDFVGEFGELKTKIQNWLKACY